MLREDKGGASSELRRTKRQSKTYSWIYKDRNTTKKDMAAPTPSSLSKTTALSANSLCNFTCDISATTMPYPLSQCRDFPALNTFYLNSEELPSCSRDAKRWQKIFEATKISRDHSTSFTSSRRKNPESTFDLFEVLTLVPMEEDDSGKRSTPGDIQSVPENTESGWSDNVRRLVKETDEAFKAVDLGLAGAKDMELEEYHNEETIANPISLSRTVSRKQHRAPIARAIIVSKPKRKRLIKPKSHRITVPKTPTPTPTPSPRWTLTELTEGMAGLLTGKIFNRMTVDEMLHPGRAQRFKIGIKTEVANTISSDTLPDNYTVKVMLPSEPSQLEDVSFDLDTADIGPLSNPDLNDCISTPPPIPSRNKKQQTIAIVTKDYDDKNVSAFQFHKITFPLPRCNAQQQLNCSDKLIPHIRSIPESISTSHTRIDHDTSSSPITFATFKPPRHGFELFNKRRIRTIQNPRLQPTTEVLESTPYSLTCLGFRHGSIRLIQHHFSAANGQEKPIISSPTTETEEGMGNEKPWSKRIGENEDFKRQRGDFRDSLDWAVLQVAISGGTGDYLIGDSALRGVNLHEHDVQTDREIDDIAEWWEGLGMSMGALETEEDSKAMRKGRLKIKIQAEAAKKPSQSPRIKNTVTSLPTNAEVAEERCPRIGPRHSIALLRTKRRRSPEADNVSLPPSPMEDFSPGAILHSSPVVPMGFNLGHDLKDFLSWENECVAEDL